MPSKRKASPASKTRSARSSNNESQALQAITLVLRPPTALQKKLATLGQAPLEPLSHETYLELYGTPEEELQRLEKWVAGTQLRPRDKDWREQARLSGAVQLLGTAQELGKHFSLKRDAGTGALQLASPKALEDLLVWVFGIEPEQPETLTNETAEPPPGPGKLKTTILQRARQASTRKARADETLDLSPLEVAKAYRYPANQGAGQCIGLIELQGAYLKKDVWDYLDIIGVKTRPRIEDVMLGSPVSGDVSDLEVTMDLELAASICPEATLVVYNACSEDYSLKDFFSVFAAAVFDTTNRPSVLSCSWAFPESVEGINARLPLWYKIGKEEEAAFNLLFMKAALLGITICAASGDPGSLISFPCVTSPTMATSLPITYFPAASPYVLGCGGTQPLSLQAPLEEEAVWNQLNQVLIIGSPQASFPAVGGSSGGGVSLLNPLPPYQEGSNVPETQVATLDDGIFTVRDRLRGRGVPDVAGFAHLNPGYAIQFKGKPAMAGGTSASTPMWAALIARINTALGKRVGFFQPSLYKHQFERKTLCKTIRFGGNGAYRAGAELWNPCTGLGTPNGEEIVKALKRG